MFLIRVSLPDRPGSLGAVATALGTVGADIQAVEIVNRENGIVVDDFMVRLPHGVMPDNAVSACTKVEGTTVLWCSRYPGGQGLELDIEALERMLGDPEHAGAILTEASPTVFHSHWSVLIDRVDRVVLHATPMAPDLTAETLDELSPLDSARTMELPAGWVPQWVETTIAIAPIRERYTIMVGRHGGPEYMASELARLGYLAALVPTA